MPQQTKPEEYHPQRGEIVLVNAGGIAGPTGQKPRPYLVVKADSFDPNHTAGDTLVVPLTSWKKGDPVEDWHAHVLIEKEARIELSFAKCDQIFCVEMKYIRPLKVGWPTKSPHLPRLSLATMARVNRALQLALDTA